MRSSRTGNRWVAKSLLPGLLHTFRLLPDFASQGFLAIAQRKKPGKHKHNIRLKKHVFLNIINNSVF